MFFRLWNALNSLPEIQGRRVDAHLILGKSYREIAREEGIKSAVRCSVLCGIKRMKKNICEKISEKHLHYPCFCLVVYEREVVYLSTAERRRPRA